MVCFPKIKEALWRISAGLTLRSETDSSRSYRTLVKAMSHASIGIYCCASACPAHRQSLRETNWDSKHQKAVHQSM